MRVFWQRCGTLLKNPPPPEGTASGKKSDRLFLKQAGMLLFDALVHEKEDVIRFSQAPRLLVDDADLEPDGPRLERDSLYDDGKDLFRPHKDVDNVHPVGHVT